MAQKKGNTKPEPARRAMDHVGEGESLLVFNPTDEEMVHCLLNKVTGKTPFVREVIECDLYGDEELWRKRFRGTKHNCLYFFTKLKKTTRKMSRSNRATAWCNTWKAQSDKKICVGEEVHIGSKRCFSLVEKKARDEPRWVMHEYRLDGVYDCHNQNNDYVICRIKRIVSKKVAGKKEEVEGDDAMAIQTNDNGILDPNVTVLKDQEMESPESSILQREDDVLGQQEETPPTGVDFAVGGGENTNWAKAYAQDLLDTSQNCMGEEEEVDLLPNPFFEDKWVRGWERVPID